MMAKMPSTFNRIWYLLEAGLGLLGFVPLLRHDRLRSALPGYHYRPWLGAVLSEARQRYAHPPLDNKGVWYCFPVSVPLFSLGLVWVLVDLFTDSSLLLLVL